MQSETMAIQVAVTLEGAPRLQARRCKPFRSALGLLLFALRTGLD
jgi:hypothetical protein